MSPERFDALLTMVKPWIEKKDTSFQQAIPADERLTLTLRFLASGDSQQSLSFSYRIGKATVSKIVSETCEVIFNVLKKNYILPPRNAVDWLNISEEFHKFWNMPHVIGCIDGKHVRVECPKRSGSLYHNYKGFFSIVLMAICDANYCFTLFDLGQYGSNNDSGILANSKMGDLFKTNSLNVPGDSNLDDSSINLPDFLLGDEIFPLKKWLMRPYPGKNASEQEKIYNYRHSRARRCIENVFGIMCAR